MTEVYLRTCKKCGNRPTQLQDDDGNPVYVCQTCPILEKKRRDQEARQRWNEAQEE